MIRLTEIITSNGTYDPEIGHVTCTYSLRSLYVNPTFIVSMTDNEKFNNMHSRRPVVEDLIAAAKFTKISLGGSGNFVSQHDILGTPENVANALHGGQE